MEMEITPSSVLIYQALTFLTIAQVIGHIIIPIMAPPVHSLDASSIIIALGTLQAFGLIIWAFNVDFLFFFDYRRGVSDGISCHSIKIPKASKIVLENKRFRAFFIMAFAAAHIFLADMLYAWWIGTQYLITIFHSGVDEPNRLADLMSLGIFLLLMIGATGVLLCGMVVVWGALNHLNEIRKEAELSVFGGWSWNRETESPKS